MTQPLPKHLPPEQLPDVAPMADAHAQALADLQRQWTGLSDKQKQQLVDAVYTAVAAGTLADLLTLPVDTAATAAALTLAMVELAAVASRQIVAEAAQQGVDLARVHITSPVFEPVAQVVTALLGDELRITAARTALQHGPEAAPTTVADGVREALDSRSDASTTKQLGGALHGAMNTARAATLRAAPEGGLYAQEMNDRNTCAPCREVSGRWLGNVPTDLPQVLSLYPDGAYGGFIGCLGGINCRGTIVGVWRPDQLAEARTARGIRADAAPHHADTTDHNDRPDYTAADLGVPSLQRIVANPQDVNIDREHYQRPLDPDRLAHFLDMPKRKLKKRVGLVAVRPDGSLWVVDGQHQVQAAVQRDIAQMAFQSFPSTGWEQEAEVYQAWQRWHAAHGHNHDGGDK